MAESLRQDDGNATELEEMQRLWGRHMRKLGIRSLFVPPFAKGSSLNRRLLAHGGIT